MDRNTRQMVPVQPNCYFCEVKFATMAPIPCGHLCICESCVEEGQPEGDKCPICSADVQSMQRVHHSIGRRSLKTPSQLLAQPFRAHGLTREHARFALDEHGGDVAEAGKKLFHMAQRRRIRTPSGNHVMDPETKEMVPAYCSSLDDDGNDEITCCVCMVQRATAVPIPCGHLRACEGCLEEVRRQDNKCPICRTLIQGVQRVHESVMRTSFKTVSRIPWRSRSTHMASTQKKRELLWTKMTVTLQKQGKN